ncbi:MAG TPA: RDD family protein [Thermoanaerobaculia bacterium]|jgi:uncharacterized RDD family membrane protein YckC|nr:RDD family protein [Thermoanaerobaculia bacterium]
MRTIAVEKRIHPIRTPEGISVPFEVAPIGDRARALLIDLFLIFLGIIGLWFVASPLGWLGQALALLAGFLLQNFYFIFCEINLGGRTIGKRTAKIRVISRDGGPLTAEAVLARNLTRDLELFLPLAGLLAPEALIPQAPNWAALLACLWIFVFAFMPLFNRDRLRCGDLVAGTLVVRSPEPVLLPDLAQAPAFRPARQASTPGIAFTREQLDIYGVHELQVLEDLLRRWDEGSLDPRIFEEVAEKIKKKIAWPQQDWRVPSEAFLRAFYAAQRGRLEQRLLFGERRERKKG